MQNKLILFLWCIFLGLICAGCPAPCDVEAPPEAAQIFEDSTPIIEALKKYKAERQDYPQSLNELVPKYLARLPEKVGGRKFTYHRLDENQFNFRVHSRNGGSYSGSCSLSEI